MYRQYRLRILRDIARVLLLPQLLVLFGIRVTKRHPSLLLRILLHIGVVPFAAVCHNYYHSYISRRTAAALGAVSVPCVRGKWPGNIDIAARFVRSMNDDYLMQFMADLFEEYGSKTLNVRILWTDQIWTMDETHVKYILTGPSFEWFHKGYYWQERFETFLGNGIFNRDKEEWYNHRLLSRPWFAKDRISDLALFERHASLALSHISDFAREHEPFDAQDLFARFTMDTASVFLLGDCVGSLHGKLPKAGEARLGPKGSAIDDDFGTFAWAFEDVQVKISTRMRVGNNWPLFELFHDKTDRSNKIVHDWLEPLVQRAVQAKKDGRTTDDETFLSHLVDNTKDAESIRFQVLNMLLAGRDTTAATLTFATYFLCLHPDVCDRLRHEILDAYGDDGLPTFDTMKNLRYLRAVLNETLRLFPPVPMNQRISDSSPHVFPAHDKVPPYYVAPGTQVLYNTLLIQRRNDLWGEDADQFRPERWLDSVARVTQNPFMFVPFHAGPRICLGQNFAYTEMTFFLVRLLQQFSRFELASDAQLAGSLPPTEWKAVGRKGRQRMERVWPKSSVTSYVKGGLWIRAVKA